MLQKINKTEEDENYLSDPYEQQAMKSRAYLYLENKLEKLKNGIVNIYQIVFNTNKSDLDLFQMLERITQTINKISKSNMNQNDPLQDEFKKGKKELEDQLQAWRKKGVQVKSQLRLEKKDEDIELKKSINTKISQSSTKFFPSSEGMGQSIFVGNQRAISAAKKMNETQPISMTMQLQKENQILKEKVQNALKNKDQEYQRFSFEMKKRDNRIQEVETENGNLRKKLQEVVPELRLMKQEKEEEERLRWHKEALSDKNPYLAEYYRKKMDEKDKDIKQLNRRLKKFAIVEKKLLVKEKAFELERADYQEQLLYMNNRVGVLTQKTFNQSQ